MLQGGLVLKKLFSRTTTVFLFLVVVFLLGASFYTYIQDRKLQSVSLNSLRMASWNLAQLDNEAGELDFQIRLMASGVGDPDNLLLRYDILWSRYDYLINSEESAPTREHDNNEERLQDLFAELRELEGPIQALAEQGDGRWVEVLAAWEPQKDEIRDLVTDNFVGDETSRLMTSVQASRNRLANLRFMTLGALIAVFIYFALAMVFVRRQSRMDPVTGLPNSNYLRTVRQVSPDKLIVACEIRRFQLVLGDYGNEGANELTRLFVRKLRKCLSSGDELVQISQSEFVMFLSPREGISLEQTARLLVEATTFDWRQPESVLHISAIFGIDPPCVGDGSGWSIRYQQAHRALAQAHEEGHSYFINGENLRKRIEEETQIHSGLSRFFNHEPCPLKLHIVYQPIVSTMDRNYVTGAEVLLRCQHESLGAIPPNRVVDLCERLGLGGHLGRWLFRRIARETAELYKDLGFHGNLSINLNPSMLTDQLVDQVQSLLIDAGVPGNALCMEITEDNAALEFETINRLIGQLRDLGVSFALNDFGTGHSSLEYVRELKVQRLKIDRCFVDGIELSEDKARFLGSIIAMAEQAYMKSVIEGVENEAQWQLVEQMGGSLIQGYHAHRPMPLADLIALLQDPATSYPLDLPVSTASRRLVE